MASNRAWLGVLPVKCSMIESPVTDGLLRRQRQATERKQALYHENVRSPIVLIINGRKVVKMKERGTNITFQAKMTSLYNQVNAPKPSCSIPSTSCWLARWIQGYRTTGVTKRFVDIDETHIAEPQGSWDEQHLGLNEA